MDDELLAQPQVMKLLDSLREQYTRYQEVCRQRSKRTQLEEIQQKVMQVSLELFSWLQWGGALSSHPRLCFLQTKNHAGDLHASCLLTNVSVLVPLTASHYCCHSDFAKALVMCGGCYECALLPWGCPFAVHCGSAWLCWRCKCLPCWQREECSQVRHLPLPMSLKVPVTEDKLVFIPLFV